jgi:hypothetical protein
VDTVGALASLVSALCAIISLAIALRKQKN